MHCASDLWVIILAGGNGSRVRHLTADPRGMPVPKQYFRLNGRESLLRTTLRRALHLTPASQVVTVVAAQHAQWWRTEITSLPARNILVQPENRGTAVGLLLPLVTILHRDPSATIVVLPADHHVQNEHVLYGGIVAAVNAVREGGKHLVLLGVVPENIDPDYGWILPAVDHQAGGPQRISDFVEKPDITTAARLRQKGGLLNTFIMVANCTELRRLYEDVLPDLSSMFLQLTTEARPLGARLDELYQRVPECDFGDAVLKCSLNRAFVLPVPSCGWIDVGTTDRFVHIQRRLASTRVAETPSMESASCASPGAQSGAADQGHDILPAREHEQETGTAISE